MPTYEYLCEKCEHEFEREQRISDPPVKTCPKCRSRKVKKLISRTSFVLKGGGWYSDLYASPQSKEADKTPKESDAAAKTDAAKDAGSSEPKKSEKSEKSESAKPAGASKASKSPKSTKKGKSAA